MLQTHMLNIRAVSNEGIEMKCLNLTQSVTEPSLNVSNMSGLIRAVFAVD